MQPLEGFLARIAAFMFFSTSNKHDAVCRCAEHGTKFFKHKKFLRHLNFSDLDIYGGLDIISGLEIYIRLGGKW